MKYVEMKAEFVRIGMWINGVLYAPVKPSDTHRTAVLAMHSDGDYLTFPAGKALAERGYVCLCANISRQQALDGKLGEVKECFEFLKTVGGVEKVVILGHSGGATLMSAYQAVAENGPEIFRDEKKIVPLGRVPELPKADGILLIDSNWGNGVMTLLSLDPCVTEDENGMKIDPRYDLAAPENGYAPEGAHYSDGFVKDYLKAQRERNERLIDEALARLAVIEKGEGLYRDDEPFCVAGGSQIAPNNRLFPQDIRYLSRTKGEWPLLHADGSQTVETVHSLRRPRDAKRFTAMLGMGAMNTTVRQYLASNAVRTTEDYGYDETGIYGIDWDSSYCCTPGNVRHVTVPALVMGMTGGYEFLAAEDIYHKLGSSDKDLAFVEGASHMLVPAKECEQFPGQFGDTVKTLFDYAARWLGEHFA